MVGGGGDDALVGPSFSATRLWPTGSRVFCIGPPFAKLYHASRRSLFRPNQEMQYAENIEFRPPLLVNPLGGFKVPTSGIAVRHSGVLLRDALVS